jgi:hypothetical protein
MSGLLAACRVLALTSLAGALVACGPERIPAPATPAPRLKGPNDAMPADLDVVVRVDLGQIRRTLGAEALGALRTRVRPDGSSRDPAAERLLSDAMARADVVVVGLRPGTRPELTDNVIALTGDFDGLSIERYDTTPPFDSDADLGAAFRVYERDKPLDRSLPARIYRDADRLLVFVSFAEIDSVERRIEGGASDVPLKPAARGVISVAARPAPIAVKIAGRSPMAAQLLGRSKVLRGHLELSSTGLSSEIELEFEFAEDARRAADAGALIGRLLAKKPGLMGQTARALTVEAVETSVVVRLLLDGAELARFLACARDAAKCES